MALDINGYNATFRAFTDFAAHAKSGSTFAQISGEKNEAAGSSPLAGRTIVAKTSFDFIGNVGRFETSRDVNNKVRALFKQAIADMFGGPEKIPPSVQDAMKLEDFGKGKPLSARRIIAVKNAIDADGTAAALSKKQDMESVKPETLAIAKEAGYVKSELPKLARATQFLAKATGMDEAEAMREVATPGSKANRLMDYGGRFMENAEDFKEGLRLVDLFQSWHENLSASVADIRKTGSSLGGYDYSSADTPSKLNAETCVNGKTRIAMEKFVFEELATKPSVNLKEQDGEKIFGFKNNNASRFFGQNFGDSCTSTVANIPPAKRETVFKVFNLFCSMAEKPEDHNIQAKHRLFDSSSLKMMLGRILRHFDEISALDAKGGLTAKNVIKTCCPDMVMAGETGNWDLKAVRGFSDNISTELRLEPEEGGKYSDMNVGQIEQLMENTGGTLDEVVDMLKGGKKLPNAQYVSEGQLSLEQFGTVEGGRKLLAADLDRGVGYVSVAENKLHLGEHPDFGFNFPGEGRFVTNGTAEGQANIGKVGDKVEAMCGKVHPKQSASVMAMLSQSGLGVLKGGLEQYGIKSEEHSVVDFTLARDEDTGDVTIRYSSPKDLPFAFEWTATVGVDGNVSTTPLRFTDEATLKKEMADTVEAIKNTRNINSKPPEVVNRVAGMLVEAAKTDSDLLALLRMNRGFVAYGIILDGANHVRSDEKIMKKLEALRDNINELRMATKGDRLAFAAGLKQLSMLEGASLKSGTITRMCEIAAKEDVGAIKNLSAKSSPQDVFNAVRRLHEIVQKACIETRAMTTFSEAGGTETTGLESFILGQILSRCDTKTLNGLKNALYSKNSVEMNSVLFRLRAGMFPPGVNIDPEKRISISTLAHSLYGTFREDLAAVVNDTLGIEEYDRPEYSDGTEKTDEKNVRNILDILVDYSANLKEAEQRSNLEAGIVPPPNHH